MPESAFRLLAWRVEYERRSNMTTQLNNDTAAPFFAAMAKGINDAARGDTLGRKGLATATTALILILKERSTDSDAYADMIRHVAGIHVNAKEAPEAFAASWAFWANAFNSDVKFDLADTKEEEDLTERREVNAPRQSRVRTLRFATSVAYAFHAANVTWANVSPTKINDMLVVDVENAIKLIPEKEPTFLKSPLNQIIVDTFGKSNLTFKHLRPVRDEALIRANVKKPAKLAPTKAKPVRDVVTEMGDVVENADSKAFDKVTKLAAFNALIKLVDALNDKNVSGRLPNSVVAPFREAVIAAIENEEKAA